MKKSINAIITLALLAGGINVFAQSKVAVVDAELVIQNSILGKRFSKEMEDFSTKRSGEIKAKFEEFKAKEKDFQAKAASLSEDKRRSLGLELERMQTDIKRMQEDAKRESDLKINEALERFRRDLIPVIKGVAESKGMDLVMNIGPGSNIAYVNTNIDITEEVVKAYDATVKE